MKKILHNAFVAFGSNLGRRKSFIERGIRLLSHTLGVQLHQVSPLYETDPVGGPKQRPFLNGVLNIKTCLKPIPLLKRLRAIEFEVGRVRRIKWGPRSLDLDLLTYDDLRLRSRLLTLPHPRLHLRRFVLVPLTYLAPNDVHPIIGQTNSGMLRELTVDGQRVTMRGRWKKTQFHLFKKRKLKRYP